MTDNNEKKVPAGAARFVRRLAGFSLVEMMIVLAIVSIIAAFAIPEYRDYVRRAQRADATIGLLQVAGMQEKFYLQNNTYTADLSAAGLDYPGTQQGYYDITVTAADATGFALQAVPAAGSPQLDDGKCDTFTLDNFGVRGSAPHDPDDCWR